MVPIFPLDKERTNIFSSLSSFCFFDLLPRGKAQFLSVSDVLQSYFSVLVHLGVRWLVLEGLERKWSVKIPVQPAFPEWKLVPKQFHPLSEWALLSSVIDSPMNMIIHRDTNTLILRIVSLNFHSMQGVYHSLIQWDSMSRKESIHDLFLGFLLFHIRTMKSPLLTIFCTVNFCAHTQDVFFCSWGGFCPQCSSESEVLEGWGSGDYEYACVPVQVGDWYAGALCSFRVWPVLRAQEGSGKQLFTLRS